MLVVSYFMIFVEFQGERPVDKCMQMSSNGLTIIELCKKTHPNRATRTRSYDELAI